MRQPPNCHLTKQWHLGKTEKQSVSRHGTAKPWHSCPSISIYLAAKLSSNSAKKKQQLTYVCWFRCKQDCKMKTTYAPTDQRSKSQRPNQHRTERAEEGSKSYLIPPSCDRVEHAVAVWRPGRAMPPRFPRRLGAGSWRRSPPRV